MTDKEEKFKTSIECQNSDMFWFTKKELEDAIKCVEFFARKKDFDKDAFIVSMMRGLAREDDYEELRSAHRILTAISMFGFPNNERGG